MAETDFMCHFSALALHEDFVKMALNKLVLVNMIKKAHQGMKMCLIGSLKSEQSALSAITFWIVISFVSQKQTQRK